MRRNLLMLFLLSIPTATFAQNRFEVTPFVGARLGGGFRVPNEQNPPDSSPEQDLALEVQSSLGGGLMLDYALNDTMQVELLWSRQSSDVDVLDVSPNSGGETTDGSSTEFSPFGISIDYFHGAFVYGGGPRRFRPYVLAGAGLSRLNPDLSGASTLSKFSFSLGTGFKSFFSDRFGVRFDARAFGTRAGERQEDVACGVFGCASFKVSSTFWQGQLVGGLIIAF